MILLLFFFFFFSSRRRHTRSLCDWSSDVCSSDLKRHEVPPAVFGAERPPRRTPYILTAEQIRQLIKAALRARPRSEERRVGKECRSRWSEEHVKKKEKERHTGDTLRDTKEE